MSCFKKSESEAHQRGPPTTGVVEQWKKKKTYFAMKTNGIRWCSYLKKKWIFPLRLIFYVCSSARNWVSAMYKGIDQFPLGSSNPGCLKFLNWRTISGKKGPLKWSISFYVWLY